MGRRSFLHARPRWCSPLDAKQCKRLGHLGKDLSFAIHFAIVYAAFVFFYHKCKSASRMFFEFLSRFDNVDNANPFGIVMAECWVSQVRRGHSVDWAEVHRKAPLLLGNPGDPWTWWLHIISSKYDMYKRNILYIWSHMYAFQSQELKFLCTFLMIGSTTQICWPCHTIVVVLNIAAGSSSISWYQWRFFRNGGTDGNGRDWDRAIGARAFWGGDTRNTSRRRWTSWRWSCWRWRKGAPWRSWRTWRTWSRCREPRPIQVKDSSQGVRAVGWWGSFSAGGTKLPLLRRVQDLWIWQRRELLQPQVLQSIHERLQLDW